ncbi:DUF998 domain-containing protein [Micromonospora sp. PPF5-17]|uniref:DUF998 domain-containing protein n=1 Tax=Micromonospora solifontis TaxID=2487138 RepID=A0ABX9WGL8_9ACTN|nr:DUF998 domain-containing protein [Micromonospora sp. PPF5-17B]NES37725.1 DUF998 domain-containing protein [Micromonospora solifontis]NES58463.1 DUF998 domain-containing protein [Micromonospora sp. PPF5-6]RNL98076.1 DUF998 domain-containing protein [Micromonospora solifontis]
MIRTRPVGRVTADAALLAGGVLAGPLWVAVALAQGLTRAGFDFRRHPVSVLSNGDLGWVQIANFVLAGLLCLGAAAALRRIPHPGLGPVSGPWLIGQYGLGLVLSGIFVADPVDGFPAGTPAPGTVSWHGLAHFAAGAVAFPALIAACLVAARRFAGRGERGWSVFSAVTGLFFAAAWLALIGSGGRPVAMVLFALAVAAGWAWVTVTLWRARRDAAG